MSNMSPDNVELDTFRQDEPRDPSSAQRVSLQQETLSIFKLAFRAAEHTIRFTMCTKKVLKLNLAIGAFGILEIVDTMLQSWFPFKSEAW